MVIEYKQVGFIKVENEDCQVMVSDPCYDSDSFSSTIISSLVCGKYKCIVGTADIEGWGNRVVKLIIVHEDKTLQDLINPIHHGVVGVDSGTMCISDIVYYDRYHTGEKKNANRELRWYDKWVSNMLGHYRTVYNKCVISQSGIGDGSYNVNRYENEYYEVFGVEVVFIN